uniref:Protein kinase domain-containing protein n=1 Tax=viral metagenome TaxID=1070528 RepID=A0A6C0F717_9ZZZZ
MATLTTALAITAGSVALIGSLYGAKAIEKAPPEVPEPPPVVAQEPAPAPAPIAEPEGAVLPVEEGAEMAGGAIGRPKWGVISSNVPTGELPPGIATAIASVTGTLNPSGLRDQIIVVTQQLDAARFAVYQADDKITKVNALYVNERKKYIEKYALSKNAETIANIYNKKLSSQGQQKGRNDPEVKAKQAEIDKASGDEKKRLEREKQEMMQAKPVDDTVLDGWTKKYSDALGEKIAADDDRADAERDKNKYQTQLTELRAKKDEQEKLVKELNAKLKTLLGLLQKQSGVNKPVQKAADWDARSKRYALAAKRFNEAESNFRIFISETWLPLAGDKTIQATYSDQLRALKTLYENAKGEMDLARMALTTTPGTKVTTAANEFSAFVGEVEEITRNAVNRDGSIKPEYAHTDGSRRGGYPDAVRVLKEYAKKEKLRIVADTYYEIANQDPQSLIRNLQKYSEYFSKILGTNQSGLVTIASERVQVGMKFEITQLVLREFVTSLLQRAANAERLLPENVLAGATNQERANARIYAALRKETNSFVDKQIYTIKKMFKAIKKAKDSVKPGELASKNLLQLQRQVQILFPIQAGVPPPGTCQLLFKPEIWKYFQTGMYDNKDILKEVLETPSDKQKFLDEIGFIRVGNFLEAQAYSKTPGADQASSLVLIQKAAFKEYVDKVDRLAYNDPDGTMVQYQTGRADDLWTALTTIPNADILQNSSLLDIFRPLFRNIGGAQMSHKDFAADLHRISDGELKFVPGVYLEASPVARPGTQPIRYVKRILPISDFKDACELDGNVGHGQAESDRILAILTQLETIEPVSAAPTDPLLKAIEKMEKKKSIDLSRRDQAQGISTLGIRGFPNGVGNWTIMKVVDTKGKEDLNFIQTFLTFRSSKFRSIQYGDTTEYNGKTWNSRELYAKLFIDHLMQMPSFESRDRKSFPTDSDWLKLSTDYHVNFILFKEGETRGTVDISAASRVGAPVYNVFKSINGRYYPILMQADAPAIPAAPRGANPALVGMINRGIFGGAVDGIVFPVPDEPAPVESTAAFVGRKLAAAPDAIARGTYKLFVRPFYSSDISCIANRGKRSFYDNVKEGIRQEECVIKLGNLLLKLCNDVDRTQSNNIGRGGFKDAFCAIVEKDFKGLKKGTKVVLLYYRKSGDEPDYKNFDGTIAFTQHPHATKEDFIKEIEPSLKRQEQAAELNIAHQLYSYGFVPGVGGFAVVEFVSGQSLADILKSKSLTEEHLLDLLKSFVTLGNNSITQLDMNTQNFILRDEKFIFIDDLSPVYKVGRKPESVQDHFLKSVQTLMMIVKRGNTPLETDFFSFVNTILNYNIVGAGSFKAEYHGDKTATKTEFHEKIIDIFANGITDAKKIETEPVRRVEPPRQVPVDERGLPLPGIPRPPPIPAGDPGNPPPPPPPWLPLPGQVAERGLPLPPPLDPTTVIPPPPPPPPGLPPHAKGGRRRTTTAWRRSKPVRYTRRKF